MTPTRLLLLSLLMLALAGCTSLRPNHVTLYSEHSEADTTGSPRAQHTSANKVGVSATYDLPSQP